MVKTNVSHAPMATFWWMMLARKTSAPATMELEQQEASAVEMEWLHVHRAALATRMVALASGTTHAKKINAAVRMAQPPQEQIVRQLVSPNAPRAAVATFLWMILARKTSAHALTVLARWAPIALTMVQANVLHVSVVTKQMVWAFVWRFNAVVLMAQRQLEQPALRQAFTNVPHAQVATPRWTMSARKTRVRVLVALRLQEQTALQWTKPNVSLATVATRSSVTHVRSTSALVPTAPQPLEMSVLQIMLPLAPRVTLAIF